MKRLTEALEELTTLFDQQAIVYAVMGGLAVRVYGIPRPTYDIDFTVAIVREDLHRIYSAVERLGYHVAEPFLKGWVDEVNGLPLVKFGVFVEGRSLDIDIFLAESAFQSRILERRKRHQVNGFEAWLVSVEDLILLKLMANRPRDIADVGDIVFTQGQLDVAYMRRWADELGLREKLEAVLKS